MTIVFSVGVPCLFNAHYKYTTQSVMNELILFGTFPKTFTLLLSFM